MRLDGIGMALSGICLLHCIAVPVIAFTVPAASGLILDKESLFHWILLWLAIPISGVAFWYAWHRHQATGTLILGALGLFVMFVGVSHIFGHENEIGITVAGAIAVAIAHLSNFVRAHARDKS